MIEIEKDIARAQAEGCAREENHPFLMGSSDAGAAILLVHGFTGSPWEMRPLAAYLAARGFLVYGPRLPGHGTTPEDLAARRMEEWLTAVEEALSGLAASGRQVFGVGQSTGALLLLLAALEHSVQGLVLLSPFLRLRHRLAPAAGLLQFFKPFVDRAIAPELRPFYYDRRPVAGIHQLNRLTRRLRRRLKRVTAPALVVSAQGDQTVLVPSGFDLFERLGGSHKEYHLFGSESPHVLTTADNPRQPEVFTLTASFLAGLRQADQPAGVRTARAPAPGSVADRPNCR